ncbi:hypothetical protein Prudu_607S000300 [Prunus dulcis]|uniref:Uncharacterized protein n=1 Tax=Prunus dulcis TaxID=3755 RepID=A0A5H2XPE4_PRUDU|nr:hypothetical protein Prudu_607S000300 [Prunus dulcis]
MFVWNRGLTHVTVFKQFASKLTALNDRLIGIKLCEGRTCPWPTPGKSIYCNIERLATGSLPTYLIGAVVLREEWKSTLSGLKKCPGNYLQALKAITRTLRMMTLYSDEPARVSLDGQLVNADEASSARAIKGGLNPEQAVAWELFSPIQRFLFVAMISVAVAESKKNSRIMKLTKSVELRLTRLDKQSINTIQYILLSAW